MEDNARGLGSAGEWAPGAGGKAKPAAAEVVVLSGGKAEDDKDNEGPVDDAEMYQEFAEYHRLCQPGSEEVLEPPDARREAWRVVHRNKERRRPNRAGHRN